MHVEVRLFNTLARYAPRGESRVHVELRPGATVRTVLGCLQIPPHELYVAMRNGTDAELLAPEPLDLPLREGDALALSGPVPWSWGYGAPVI